MSETLSFSVGPVDPNGGTSLVHETILADTIDILKIKVVPDNDFGTSEVFIYRKSTGQLTDLAYRTRAWPNSIALVDKIEDNQGVTSERGPATVTRYVNEDGDKKLHLKIRNNHTEEVTYSCTIEYDLVASAITPAVTCTGGNPAGASSLVVLTRSDDATIPFDSIVLEWNRDTTNFDSIYAVMAVISSTLPAEGPYQTERESAGAGFILETGTCTITAGSTSIVVTRGSDSAVIGGVLLVYTDDTDLDGNVVSAQGVDSLTVDTPFRKSGTFTYTIVLPWWVLTNIIITKNKQVIPLSVDEVKGATKAFGLDPLGTKWRTPPIQIPKGTFYATLYSRNPCGLGERLTSSQFTFIPVPTTVDPQLFTDFSDRSLWLPMYHPAVTLVFNADGSVDMHDAGGGDDPSGSRQMFAGVRSNFTLLADATGVLKFRAKFNNYTGGVTSAPQDEFLGVMFEQIPGSYRIIGIKDNGDARAASGCGLGAWNNLSLGDVGGGYIDPEPADSVEFEVTIEPDETSTPKEFLVALRYRNDGGSWTTFGAATTTRSVGGNIANLQVFLGLQGGDRKGGFGGKLTEFELMQGILVL
jgi:hypothetical protein